MAAQRWIARKLALMMLGQTATMKFQPSIPKQRQTQASAKKMNQIKVFIATLLCAALAACVTTRPEATPTSAEVATATETATDETQADRESTEYGNFSEDQLYRTIISELGAQRGQLEDAGQGYFDLAIETRDLSIIRRAIQFASINNDVNALLQLGLLWAEISPEDAQPHRMLSIQFLENGAFDQALSHMARVIDLGGNIDFSSLSARTGQLSPQARAGLISNLRQLAQEFPEQESIPIALVRLLAQNGEFEAALDELRIIDETTSVLVLLEAQVLQSMDQDGQALRTMRNGVRRFTEDKDLRFNYARLLIQSEAFAEAQEQFQILIEQNPQDWETHYSIALLDLELENYEAAIESFRRLIGADQRSDESQYYLGYIFDQQGELEKAIEHYRQVRIGTNNFLAAQNQATIFSIRLGQLDDAHAWLSRLYRGQPRLEILFTTIEATALIQADHPTQAEALLDKALNKFPNETDLLFARVLYYDSISNRQGSESDLHQILRMKPDDSRALNHLGYMLADQTTRFDEALELIERAIAISPDDPAIIDSLAWAQYKLGRYEDALANLRRAFAAFPDHEVASHLGEVLWIMGRKDEAASVWQDALETRPDSNLIKEAMERLQPQ